MTIATHQRILVLVDEANFAAAARTFNRRTDWLVLRDYLASPESAFSYCSRDAVV